ncbi:MAG: hypothetical protein IJK64_01325 [Clostridia bacterium]|nr:hypothetical protein [Clostridia bacterium]
MTALLLSILLIICSSPPVFAEEEENTPKLIAVEILSVPEKNLVVDYGFPGDNRVPPDGIVVKLLYDDGTEITDTIQAVEQNGGIGYVVAGVPVYTPRMLWLVIDDPAYGEMTARLYFGEELIEASYTYLSVNPDAPKTPMEKIRRDLTLLFLRMRWALEDFSFLVAFVFDVLRGKYHRGILPEIGGIIS